MANDSRRPTGCSTAQFELVQALEARVLMAAAVATVTPRVTAVLKSLTDLTKLPAKTARYLDAAGADLYTPVKTLGKAANGSTTLSQSASAYAPFTLDLPSVKQRLATAPMEFTAAAGTNALTLALPTPEGQFSRFKIVEAPIMEAGLAKKLPYIKTFRGQGIDDPTASIRLDYTQLGFHAQVLSPKGTYYIDPYHLNDVNGTYVSYFKRDAIAQGSFNFQEPENDVTLDPKTPQVSPALDTTYGTQLKTYRACVAATGEYTAAVGGGTQAGGQAAIVSAMNRVTGVYETELDIRMVLIANNMNVVYTNSSTDPYTNNNGNSMLSQNVSTLSSVIGNSNFDIGHVFSTGGGGVAFLGVVGRTNKAGGVTGSPSPTGDAFWIDYVAHEMGHQFGADHTFNTLNDANNRSASHAYEPGSGSTIMAYAGIEGPENLQLHSDPYFHSDSIDAIRSYVTNTIPSIGTPTNTGNNAPAVSAGLTYSIPTGTPFVLTASGSDPDGDIVTYDWQERDLGAAVLLTTADNGTSPILRDWTPTTNPSRTVPQLANLLANTFAKGEKLPAVARTNNFKWRVIAHDNRSGGGGVSTSDVTLSVVNTGASFAVTNPNTTVAWDGDSTQTVTWNVAGTTGNGINVANVKISLSTNGGNSFNTVLLASTPNDGSADITVPNVNTSQARIKVEAIDNIFFDISNTNFTINQAVGPNGVWTGLGDGINWSDDLNWSNDLTPGPADDAVLNIAANPTIVVSGGQSVKSVTSSEALNITGTLTIAQPSQFNAPVTLSGTLSGNGNATFNDSLDWTGSAINGNGNLSISNTGSFTISGAGVHEINRPFALDGLASLTTGGDQLLRLNNNTLTIGATGQLDLNDNDFLWDYAGAAQLPAVQNYLNAARTGGTWLGTTGIMSTTAKNNGSGNTTLAAMPDTDYTFGTFDGVSVPSTSVLVKYTYYGDTDFNGGVNFDDYVKLDVGYNSNFSGWVNGDFNGDGLINFDDYVAIDIAYNTQTGIL